MIINESLTSFNFWDKTAAKYPNATGHFFAWFQEYQKLTGWLSLFNSNAIKASVLLGGGIDYRITTTPSFMELPHALQHGIFTAYVFSFEDSGDFIEATGWTDELTEIIDCFFSIREHELTNA